MVKKSVAKKKRVVKRRVIKKPRKPLYFARHSVTEEFEGWLHRVESNVADRICAIATKAALAGVSGRIEEILARKGPTGAILPINEVQEVADKIYARLDSNIQREIQSAVDAYFECHTVEKPELRKPRNWMEWLRGYLRQ